ncbi:MAG: DUF1552 domain-containing protein [Myxococcaceae bacterium]|nr:DUF1552 domain-containing protein [Myxococcaceae bacterium]
MKARDLPDVIAQQGTPLSRRWLLKGAGGALLAIPVLPSLLSEAQAQTAAANRKIFLAYCFPNSTIRGDAYCPSGLPVAEVKDYAGFSIRRTQLKGSASGGVMRVSDVLSTSSGLLTDALIAKANVIRGCDYSGSWTHNSMHLGNFGVGQGFSRPDYYRRSIDQVLADSPSFYPSFGGTRRSVLFGSGPYEGTPSYASRNGSIVGLGSEQVKSAYQLYSQLFGGFVPGAPTAKPRKSVVDLVSESFKKLRGDARLSSGDKLRLDQHVEHLAEIERRQQVVGTLSCPGKPSAPADLQPAGEAAGSASHVATLRSYEDVLVAALQCNLTRVAVCYTNYNLFSFGDTADWHHQIEHFAAGDPLAQGKAVEAARKVVSEVVVPLAAKLDAITDTDGKTLLDRSLIFPVSEMGEPDHGISGRVFVTFGGADGAVRTGNFLDYRNLGSTPRDGVRFGLTIQQLYGSILQAMGVPRSEWGESTNQGYGARPLASDVYGGSGSGPTVGSVAAHPDAVWAVAGEKLPWFGV